VVLISKQIGARNAQLISWQNMDITGAKETVCGTNMTTVCQKGSKSEMGSDSTLSKTEQEGGK